MAFRSPFERAQSDSPLIFFFIFTRHLLLKNFQNFSIRWIHNHQIRHKKLSIEWLKNQLSTLLGEKIHCSNLFYVFLKTSFLCKAPNCDTGNHPLTSSDRAEIFTKDTLKYLPEVESAVLISDVSVRIYRVLNVKNFLLAKTFTYFFYKKKESEIFEKAQNYLWDIVVDTPKQFSAQSDKVRKGLSVSRWKSMENQGFS
jgi:hypothetical protein